MISKREEQRRIEVEINKAFDSPLTSEEEKRAINKHLFDGVVVPLMRRKLGSDEKRRESIMEWIF